jgi:hypothetical protein
MRFWFDELVVEKESGIGVSFVIVKSRVFVRFDHLMRAILAYQKGPGYGRDLFVSTPPNQNNYHARVTLAAGKCKPETNKSSGVKVSRKENCYTLKEESIIQ